MPNITSFGLFWRRDQVEWDPGQGVANTFRLGGKALRTPKRRVCDFRNQQGIYVLYDEYGANYVGLSGRRKNGSALGQRLKEHTSDHLSDSWSRFSWFGYDPVSEPDEDNVCHIAERAAISEISPVSSTIRDTEALLLNLLRPKLNDSITRFTGGEEWLQIDFDDLDKYF